MCGVKFVVSRKDEKKVSSERGICGSKRDERYDSTGLLSDRYQLIYRYCKKVVEYTPTGLTVSRGVASSPQGSPRALASAGRRRGQRSNLLGGVR
jgi:hypothetical protein